MQKNSGSISKVLIVIAVIVVVGIILAIGAYFIFDNAQYTIVSEEVNKINTSKTVDMNIKSKGRYQNLEKGIKEYANEYYENFNKLKELYSKDDLKNCLAIDNIKNDGPNFDNTKNTINVTKEDETKIKTRLQEMVSEEYLNKKAEELNLDSKMKELFLSTLNLKSDVEAVTSISESYDKCLAGIEDILNFLNENQSGWSIKNEKIMFNSVDLLTKYNSLVSTHKINQTQLANKARK